MSDPRTTAGVLIAGACLVAAVAGWPPDPFDGIVGTTMPLLVVLGAVAFLTFSAGRHDVLPDEVVAFLAGATGIGIAIGGLVVVTVGEPGSVVRTSGGVSGMLGVAIAGIASAIHRNRPLNDLAEETRIVLLGVGIGYGGIALAGVLGSLHTLLGFEPSPVVDFAIGQVGVGIGLILAVVVFVTVTDRGIAYLDLRRPSGREIGYMLVGAIGIAATAMAVQFVLGVLGVEFAPHTVEQRANEEGPALLLVAVIGAFFAQGLGEELLFRNGVQKFLTEGFTGSVAIGLTSLIFASIHYTAYGGAGGSLLVVFVLSIVLGAVYHRTENLLVPVVMHGGYNALMWLLIYVQLV